MIETNSSDYLDAIDRLKKLPTLGHRVELLEHKAHIYIETLVPVPDDAYLAAKVGLRRHNGRGSQTIWLSTHAHCNLEAFSVVLDPEWNNTSLSNAAFLIENSTLDNVLAHELGHINSALNGNEMGKATNDADAVDWENLSRTTGRKRPYHSE